MSEALTAILSALLGTGLLVGFAAVLAAPLGIGLALWARWLAPPRLRPTARDTLVTLGGVPPACLAVGLAIVPAGDWASAVALTVVGLAVVAVPAIAERAYETLDAVSGEAVLQTVSLGASPSQAVATVVLPQARPGLWRAAVVGLGRAMGETVVVVVLLDGLSAHTTTLTRALVLGSLDAGGGTVAAWPWTLGILAMVGAGAAVAAHRRGVVR